MAELFVVATPIGNLSDLTPRMADTLAGCDMIAAEDTRVTMKLLSHLGIKKPMISMNRHTEEQKAPALIERMVGEDLKVCLTCDAGTPGISDPGNQLVAAALEAGVRVTPISGPSALITHLSASGFDTRSFGFYGFLPREKGALQQKLKEIGKTGLRTAVFYESPHRVVDLVRALGHVFPDCRLSVACDLTKLYEKILTGPWRQVLAQMEENPNVEKGEYSVAVQLPEELPQEETKLPIEGKLMMALLDGQELDEAARQAIEQGYPRNQVYKAKLRIMDFLYEEEE